MPPKAPPISRANPPPKKLRKLARQGTSSCPLIISDSASDADSLLARKTKRLRLPESVQVAAPTTGTLSESSDDAPLVSRVTRKAAGKGKTVNSGVLGRNHSECGKSVGDSRVAGWSEGPGAPGSLDEASLPLLRKPDKVLKDFSLASAVPFSAEGSRSQVIHPLSHGEMECDDIGDERRPQGSSTGTAAISLDDALRPSPSGPVRTPLNSSGLVSVLASPPPVPTKTLSPFSPFSQTYFPWYGEQRSLTSAVQSISKHPQTKLSASTTKRSVPVDAYSSPAAWPSASTSSNPFVLTVTNPSSTFQPKAASRAATQYNLAATFRLPEDLEDPFLDPTQLSAPGYISKTTTSLQSSSTGPEASPIPSLFPDRPSSSVVPRRARTPERHFLNMNLQHIIKPIRTMHRVGATEARRSAKKANGAAKMNCSGLRKSRVERGAGKVANKKRKRGKRRGGVAEDENGSGDVEMGKYEHGHGLREYLDGVHTEDRVRDGARSLANTSFGRNEVASDADDEDFSESDIDGVYTSDLVKTNDTIVSSKDEIAVCPPVTRKSRGEVNKILRGQHVAAPETELARRSIEEVDHNIVNPHSAPSTGMPVSETSTSTSGVASVALRNPTITSTSASSQPELPSYTLRREAELLRGFTSRYWLGGFTPSSALAEINAALRLSVMKFSPEEGAVRMKALAETGKLVLKEGLVWYPDQDPDIHQDPDTPLPARASKAVQENLNEALNLDGIPSARFELFKVQLHAMISGGQLFNNPEKEDELGRIMEGLNRYLDAGEKLSVLEVCKAFVVLKRKGDVMLTGRRVRFVER